MKRSLLALALAALTVLSSAAALPPQAHAHAVHAQSPAGLHPHVLAFEYATGDIPAYVQVEVYAPGETEIEFQNGRTDARGRFTFTPDKPGVWTVVMGDGMGHQLRHEVNVPEALFTPAAGAGTVATRQDAAADGLSAQWKALLGVSILCNIFLGLHLFRRRTAAKG